MDQNAPAGGLRVGTQDGRAEIAGEALGSGDDAVHPGVVVRLAARLDIPTHDDRDRFGRCADHGEALRP